jgi:hypothetical protein
MVLVQLMGGLGNQLFQAAAGIALAEQKQQPLVFHFEDSYKYAKRNFALEAFSIEHQSTSSQALSKYLPKRGLKRRLYQLMMLPVNGKIHRETEQFRFDTDFLELPSEVYLSGFWQSYKYIEHSQSKIRTALTFRSNPAGKNQELLQQIQSSKNAVSLHFRRGDYAHPQSGYYILPLKYYEYALQRLEAQFGELNLFVFSDDQDWVKKEFKTRHTMTFVDHNDGATAHEDLRLMAACAHNIIANSSLSWWGAYLNTNKNKQVFVPEVWNTTLKVADTELIPPEWITVQI